MEKQVKEQAITFSAAFALRRMIGKFSVATYGDMEAIKAKATQLDAAINQFAQSHGGDEAKANELFTKESELTKKDLAYLSKDEFKQVIFQRGFEFEQVQLLEYWLVK